MRFHSAAILALWAFVGGLVTAETKASQAGIVKDVVAAMKSIPSCNRVYAQDTQDLMDVVGSGLDEPTKMTGHFQGVARAFNSNYIYASSSAKTSGNIFSIEFKQGDADGSLAAITGTVKSQQQVDPIQHHAGGISIFDDILVVGTEGKCDSGKFASGECDSIVHFFKLDNMDNPTRLPYKIVREGKGAGTVGITAGAVALTSLAGGKFLLAVGEWGNNPIRWYLSKLTEMGDSDPQFQEVSKLTKDQATYTGEAQGLSWGDYQNMDLVRQVNGKLYMLATHAVGDEVTTYLGYGTDVVDVFEIPLDSDDAPTGMNMVLRKTMDCSGGTNFRNGANVFVPGGSSLHELVMYSIDRNTAGAGVFLNEYWHPPCERDTGGTCSVLSCDASRNAICDRSGIDECVCQDGMCAESGVCVAVQQITKKCKKPAQWPQAYTPAFCPNDAATCSIRDLMAYTVSCTLGSFGKADVLCLNDGETFQLSGCHQLDASSCQKNVPDDVCGTQACAVNDMCVDVAKQPTCDRISRSNAKVKCPGSRKQSASNVEVGSCMMKETKKEYDKCLVDLCCEGGDKQAASAAMGISLNSFFELVYMVTAFHGLSHFAS